MTEEELKYQIEQAATSLLTDSEICVSLNISEAILKKHYNIVEKARIKLKQKLNAKKISDAAQSGEVDTIVETIPRNNNQLSKYRPSRGGKREGAGRKHGTLNKITGVSILAAIEAKAGQKFEDLLAQGYIESIENRDKVTRLQYEKLFLSKVVSDKVEIDYESMDTNELEARIKVLTEKMRNQDDE
jgi:hypothetical protein